jgi:hypothetical protein
MSIIKTGLHLLRHVRVAKMAIKFPCAGWIPIACLRYCMYCVHVQLLFRVVRLMHFQFNHPSRDGECMTVNVNGIHAALSTIPPMAPYFGPLPLGMCSIDNGKTGLLVHLGELFKDHT